MGIVLPYPESKTPFAHRAQRLTKQECDSVLAETYLLMLSELAIGVCIENDREYMIVFDCRGEPYFISRKNGMCYLLERSETMVTSSQRFEEVLETLKILLKENQNKPVTS